jgi:hypothetical protein
LDSGLRGLSVCVGPGRVDIHAADVRYPCWTLIDSVSDDVTNWPSVEHRWQLLAEGVLDDVTNAPSVNRG